MNLTEIGTLANHIPMNLFHPSLCAQVTMASLLNKFPRLQICDGLTYGLVRQQGKRSRLQLKPEAKFWVEFGQVLLNITKRYGLADHPKIAEALKGGDPWRLLEMHEAWGSTPNKCFLFCSQLLRNLAIGKSYIRGK